MNVIINGILEADVTTNHRSAQVLSFASFALNFCSCTYRESNQLSITFLKTIIPLSLVLNPATRDSEFPFPSW